MEGIDWVSSTLCSNKKDGFHNAPFLLLEAANLCLLRLCYDHLINEHHKIYPIVSLFAPFASCDHRKDKEDDGCTGQY